MLHDFVSHDFVSHDFVTMPFRVKDCPTMSWCRPKDQSVLYA